MASSEAFHLEPWISKWNYSALVRLHSLWYRNWPRVFGTRSLSSYTSWSIRWLWPECALHLICRRYDLLLVYMHNMLIQSGSWWPCAFWLWWGSSDISWPHAANRLNWDIIVAWMLHCLLLCRPWVCLWGSYSEAERESWSNDVRERCKMSHVYYSACYRRMKVAMGAASWGPPPLLKCGEW